jgi:hypothetical protein
LLGTPTCIEERQPAGSDTGQAGQPQGKTDYPQCSRKIEAVFGQVKTVEGGWLFMRRGLRARQGEWKLLCGPTTLLKRWRHSRSRPAPTLLAT